MNKTKLRFTPRPKFSGEQFERLREMLHNTIGETEKEIEKILNMPSFTHEEKTEWVKDHQEALAEDRKLLAKIQEVEQWKI